MANGRQPQSSGLLNALTERNKMRTLLKDASGKTIGYLVDVSPYRKEVRLPSGAVAGWFNPQTGKTHDRTGSVVSNSGEMRASLISQDR